MTDMIQREACICEPTEEGSVWSTDCPLHGVETHERNRRGADIGRYRDALKEIHAYVSRVLSERGDSNPNWGIVMKVDRLAYNALTVEDKLAAERDSYKETE